MSQYPKEAKIECPRCEGKGYLHVDATNIVRTNERGIGMRNKIRELGEEKAKSMSLRSLAKAIGSEMKAQSMKYQIRKIDDIGWDMYE
jgi:hypothetical protein